MFADLVGRTCGWHNNIECGLVYILPTKPYKFGPEQTAPVPLQSVSILASVVHAVAQVELTQVFKNREQQPIEAIYYFPVDSNGGVTHFHAELEGRTIKGVVKPQEEANAQYEQAVAAKQTAFLVQSNKSDIFKVKVGYLKPGVEVKVVIGYVTEVKNEKGSNALRFFIPTTVAPRYTPSMESDHKALDLKNMQFSHASSAPLSIRVNVSIQGPIKMIHSATHNVNIIENAPIPEKLNWTRGIVELVGKTTDMDRDFVLLVTPDEVHVPRLYSERFEGSTAVMSHLIPSFELDEQKVELIFILDRSGSMHGQSMELARRALTLFLHSAPVDCFFNIVGFGGSHQFLFPNSVKYDNWSLEKAITHANYMQADLGGTEIYHPLKEVLTKRTIPGYLRQIFVITDGEVSNTEQVIGLVKAYSHYGRVFALGIGNSSSHSLVEGLADVGSGTAEFVTYNEKIEAKILQQLKNAIQPSLMDVKVDWTGVSGPLESQPVIINREKTLLGYGKPMYSIEDEPKESYSQVPKEVPPIYDGAQLLVFGLFQNEIPTGATISAQSPDGPLSIEIKMDEENYVGSNGMIHKLAVIKMIRELELEIASLDYTNAFKRPRKSEQDEALKMKIIELSVKNGVVSKYTSFVAVDTEGEKGIIENLAMQTRYVPSQISYNRQSGSIAYSFHAPSQGNLVSLGPGGSHATQIMQQQQVGVVCRGASLSASAPRQQQQQRFFSRVAYRSTPTLSAMLSLRASTPRPQLKLQMQQQQIQQQQSFSFGAPTSGFSFGAKNSGKLLTQTQYQQEPNGNYSTTGSSYQRNPVDFSRKATCFSFQQPVDDNSLFHAASLTTESDRLHALIATQSFDGSFPLDETFATVIGTTLDALNTEARSRGWDPEGFATAVAIAYLAQKLADLKESWDLVEIKARKWLKRNFSENHVEILSDGTAFVALMK